MPETKVTDEKGITHIFPDGATPEMIAEAMGVKAATPEDLAPDAIAQARQKIQDIPQYTSPTEKLRSEVAFAQSAPPPRNLNSLVANNPFDPRTRYSDYQRSSGRLAGETAATMATGGFFPIVRGAGLIKNLAPALGRAFMSGAGMGGGALIGGATPSEAKTSAEFGALGQPVGDLLATGARAVAPKIAESALGVTEKMRSRGRTPGAAVIEETRGVTPATIKQSAQSSASDLTGQMEDLVDQATQAGLKGSTQPAHDVLNDALNTLPRNARTLRDKVAGLRDLLDLTPVPPGQARKMIHTPNELLEMKRGIGKEIDTWPPEWQKIPDVQQIKQRLYGALDNELDKLAPGTADLNQRISSVLPVKSQASKLANAPSFFQKSLGRVGAHTGALTSSTLGGILGYERGGGKGAALGALTGLVLPEALARPESQMFAARAFDAASKVPPGYLMPYLRQASDSFDPSWERPKDPFALSQEGQP